MPGVEEDQSGAGGRLLLISNRLPITIKRSDDGQYSFSMSSGGLVTGLSGLSKTTSFQWYGWPGLEVPEAEAGSMRQRLRDEYGAVPVFVDDELADRHYNGFASTLPLNLAYPFARLLLTEPPNRLDPVAPFPLPPRRDHLRRVGLGGLPRGQPALRQGGHQGCTRRGSYLGARLPLDVAAADASRGDW